MVIRKHRSDEPRISRQMGARVVMTHESLKKSHREANPVVRPRVAGILHNVPHLQRNRETLSHTLDLGRRITARHNAPRAHKQGTRALEDTLSSAELREVALEAVIRGRLELKNEVAEESFLDQIALRLSVRERVVLLSPHG